MEEVRPTRAELLDRRGQIVVAEQGMELLKSKRDALMLEFMSVIDETLRLSGLLTDSLMKAQYAIELARAIDGESTVHSAALASKGEVLMEIDGRRVMGVAVPVVKRGPRPERDSFNRGYSPTGVSSHISEAAEQFEAAIAAILEYAEIETRLKRLGEEITKTNRRVNALEQIRIPELKEQVAYISQTLDERSREELFRLKKVKKNIERKKNVPQ